MNVYNKREEYPIEAVCVDRSTDWGNPFIMHSESQRNAVCEAFEAYAQWRLTYDPHWLDPLKGKSLVCWCAPYRCHAQTLLRLANQPEKDQP